MFCNSLTCLPGKGCFERDATKRKVQKSEATVSFHLNSDWLKFFEIYIDFVSFFLNQSNRFGRSLKKIRKKLEKKWQEIAQEMAQDLVVSFSIAGASQSKLPKGRFWIK